MGRLLLIGHDPALAGALSASHHLAGTRRRVLRRALRGHAAPRPARVRRRGDRSGDKREPTIWRSSPSCAACARESGPSCSRPRSRAPTSSRHSVSTSSPASPGRSTTKKWRTWRAPPSRTRTGATGSRSRRDFPTGSRLRVSCRLITADRLTRFMTEYSAGILSSERDLLMTAFREMLLNAMEHGAGFDPEKVIEVTAAQTARAIVFHFRDPGAGFDRDGSEPCRRDLAPGGRPQDRRRARRERHSPRRLRHAHRAADRRRARLQRARQRSPADQAPEVALSSQPEHSVQGGRPRGEFFWLIAEQLTAESSP